MTTILLALTIILLPTAFLYALNRILQKRHLREHVCDILETAGYQLIPSIKELRNEKLSVLLIKDLNIIAVKYGDVDIRRKQSIISYLDACDIEYREV